MITFPLTFLAATGEPCGLMAVTIARAVFALWSATAVVFLALGIYQRWVTVAGLHFHTCTPLRKQHLSALFGFRSFTVIDQRAIILSIRVEQLVRSNRRNDAQRVPIYHRTVIVLVRSIRKHGRRACVWERACIARQTIPSIARRSIDRIFPLILPGVCPTLAEIERPQPELLLPLASLHLHGAEGRVESEVAAADRPHVLLRNGAAVEPAAASGKLVRAELAGRLEVAVDVLAGLALLRAGHIGDGGSHAGHRGR